MTLAPTLWLSCHPSNRRLQLMMELVEQAQDLGASGYEQVVSQAVYAIVGAIALQRGGEVVNRVVKDRILAPLGLT